MRKYELIEEYKKLKPLYGDGAQMLIEGFIQSLESLDENDVRSRNDIVIRGKEVLYDGFGHGYPQIEDMKKFVLECIDKELL